MNLLLVGAVASKVSCDSRRRWLLSPTPVTRQLDSFSRTFARKIPCPRLAFTSWLRSTSPIRFDPGGWRAQRLPEPSCRAVPAVRPASGRDRRPALVRSGDLRAAARSQRGRRTASPFPSAVEASTSTGREADPLM